MMEKKPRQFPEFYASAYQNMKADIIQRLEDFRAPPEHDWFYEACYCILTPQSKAVHADLVVKQLINMNF